MVNIVQNVVDLIGYIGDAATTFPSSALLVLIGALLIAVSTLAMAYLTAGAVVDALIPESIGRRPPQRD